MPEQVNLDELRQKMGLGSPAPEPAPRKASPDPADLFRRLTGSEPSAPPEEQSSSRMSGLFQGLLRGGRDVLEGGAQIGARMGPEEGAAAFSDPAELTARQETVDASVRSSERAYQDNPAVRAHPIVSGAGRIGGNMAAMAPLAAVPGAGVGMGTGAGMLARGALTGAAGAATQPVQQTEDYWGEKLKAAGMGAGVGAALPGLGSMISPRLPNPELVSEGVAKAFRPLYNFFTGAEERTTHGFDRTIARQVLDPIGGRIDGRPYGHELMRQTEDQISDSYNRVLPNITLRRGYAEAPDSKLDNFVSTMSDDHRDRFQKLVKQFESHFPESGIMDGNTFQRARSELSGRASSWIGTNDNELGRAAFMKLNQLNERVAETNPQWAPQLQRTNESFRLWTRMREASNAKKGGEFTPGDLLGSINKQDSAVWRGDKPLQGYALAAMKAMGPEKASLGQLAQLFTRHGLAAQAAEATAGPLARGAKATSPITSPVLGMREAREMARPPSPETRAKDRLNAARKVGEISSDLAKAKRISDLGEVQKQLRKLAAAQAEYRRLGGGQ